MRALWSFPQLAPHNLPAPISSFVGREAELVQVVSLLQTARLVTLTGMPGVGKTRLGLQVAALTAEGYPHGAWLVQLASLTESALVPQAVASALSARDVRTLFGLDGDSVALVEHWTAALVGHLRHRQVLLMIDNCEHLLDPCAELTETLLRTCPGLCILATSREALGVTGEVTFRVPPLSTSSLAGPAIDAHADINTDDGHFPTTRTEHAYPEAVRLFVERATAIEPTFTFTPAVAAAVGEICRRLDGIPLAIELAAARVGVLSPAQIAARLDDRFRLLTCGSRTATPRHQTLRAALEWSYELLSAPEQLLLRRLSVFAGGATLDAAEEVCSGADLGRDQVFDALARLVATSLVGVDAAGAAPRYWLANSTIQHYGQHKAVVAGEKARLQRAHAAWYAGLARQAEEALSVAWRPAWLGRLGLEHANLRAALRWSLDSDQTQTALQLIGALSLLWSLSGWWQEPWIREENQWRKERGWLAWALSVQGAPARLRGKVLWAAGVLSIRLGQTVTAAAAAAETEAKAERAEAMAANLPSPLQLFEEALVTARQGDDTLVIAQSLYELSALARAQGDGRRATSLCHEALALQVEISHLPGAAASLESLAGLAADQGRLEQAARLFGAAQALRNGHGGPRFACDQFRYDVDVVQVRKGLSAQKMAVAWAEGATLSLRKRWPMRPKGVDRASVLRLVGPALQGPNSRWCAGWLKV